MANVLQYQMLFRGLSLGNFPVQPWDIFWSWLCAVDSYRQCVWLRTDGINFCHAIHADKL